MTMLAMRWLNDAVIYQIYPQSFQDSNGDGIGDFQGIIRRLDYIRDLGVNTIWLNPCFDSPFGDAGYDVRDYYQTAARYGTENELIQLFQEAHRRNLRVVLDLVAGHTSIEHPWFVAEAQNPKSSDANRYIWKNRDFDLSQGPDRKDFVSNFFWFQPALNFGYANPAEPWQDPVDAPGPQKNRRELRRVMAYWFDRGCDGFRVDMASSLVKGESPAKERTVALWRENREWLDLNYPHCALVAEWGNPVQSIQAGFHLDFLMHCNAPGYPALFFNGTGPFVYKDGPCYFSPQGEGKLDAVRRDYFQQVEGTRGRGYVSLPTSNHDFQRLCVGDRETEGLRPAWVFLMTQAGVPVIYYGDEIGMRYVSGTPPKEGSTLGNLAVAYGKTESKERSGSRTPMQWDPTEQAGFSTAAPDQFYLPVDPDPARPNVAYQSSCPESLLNFVRRLLRLRVEYPALGADGDFFLLNPPSSSYPMVYRRQLATHGCLVVVNPAADAREVVLPVEIRGALILDGGVVLVAGSGLTRIRAPGFGYGIFSY